MDKRFDQILNFITELSLGNFSCKISPSESLDDTDALINAVVMLGEELKASQDKQAAFFELSGDAILIYCAASNKFIDSNISATNLLGFSKQDIRLLSILDLLPKKEKIRVGSKVTYLKSVVQIRFDIQVETETGKLKDVSLLSKMLPYGDSNLFQISLRDVSESKEVLNRLVKKSIAFKNATKEISFLSKFPSENPNPILRFNKNLKLIYANEASAINFLSDFKIKGTNLHDLILKSRLKTVGFIPENFIETRNERHYSLTLVYVQEHNYINIYGSDISGFIKQVDKKEKVLIGLKERLEIKVAERTAELRANELKLQDSLIKEKERTTQLIYSETNLQTSLIKEKELGELKSSFVSTASHQFRTPLAVIQANTDLLQILNVTGEKQKSEKCKKITNRITEAISQMIDLMDGLLDINYSRLGYYPEDVNLVECCDKLVQDFNLIQQDGRTLNFVKVGNSCNMQLDPKLLNNALVNLISNAFKYSEGKESPQLHIHCKPAEVVLSVKDFGLGVPEFQLSKLFEPFFRADNVIGIKGNGLGLSISKEYVERNKGSIKAKSILGKGSCFEIIFKREKL